MLSYKSFVVNLSYRANNCRKTIHTGHLVRFSQLYCFSVQLPSSIYGCYWGTPLGRKGWDRWSTCGKLGVNSSSLKLCWLLWLRQEVITACAGQSDDEFNKFILCKSLLSSLNKFPWFPFLSHAHSFTIFTFPYSKNNQFIIIDPHWE